MFMWTSLKHDRRRYFFMEEMARLDYVRMGNELQPQYDGVVIVS